MSTYVFIERSRLGKVFYEVKADHVRVSGWRAMEGFEAEVEFHSLSPRFERLSRRFYRPIAVGLGLGSLMAAMCLGFVFQKRVDFGAVLYFAEATGIFAVAFLAAGFRWLPRLEIVRFKDVVGGIAFDAVKERAYSEDFEEFVEVLRSRIIASKENSFRFEVRRLYISRQSQ